MVKQIGADSCWPSVELDRQIWRCAVVRWLVGGAVWAVGSSAKSRMEYSWYFAIMVSIAQPLPIDFFDKKVEVC